MDRKQTETMPCKNCGMMPNEHQYGPNNDLMCEIERLPLQIQEAYYRPAWYKDNSLRPYVIYYPMDSLQYLEWEYERSISETPTRSNLR